MLAGADASRFEILWSTHAGRVLAYARRRVPQQDAEEVLAETFVTAWRRIDAVPQDALPWLLAVARRFVSNKRRGANRRAALVSRLRRAVRQHDSYSVGGRSRDVSEAVLMAMGTLSERDREALMLAYWDDLDPTRAAQVVGCSPRAFSTRLYRARRHFANVFTEIDATSVERSRSIPATDKEAIDP
jgi:RNA polymerase sigma-70 factor (ECF subfamily)